MDRAKVAFALEGEIPEGHRIQSFRGRQVCIGRYATLPF